MPKISVIVAVYNVEPYLKRSLDCLINQTMTDIEFICIDDCSTDNSLQILKEYEQKDSRFKIITSEVNGGAAIARNKGLDVATGDYLGFIDPDDTIDLNYYEELYKKAKETNTDIVKCQLYDLYSDGTKIKSSMNKWIKKNKYSFTYEWTTAIYRASIVFDNNIRFPEECTKAQDVVFLNRIMLKAKNVECIDTVFYYYHKRENSLNASKIPIKSVKSACKAKILMAEDLNESELFKNNSEQYAKKYSHIMNTVFFTLFQNNTIEAKEMCAKSFIELYHLTLDKNLLEKYFLYPDLIKYAKEKNLSELSTIFENLKSRDEIREKFKKTNLSFLQKIFSIKNSLEGNYKIITIFNFKIKFLR